MELIGFIEVFYIIIIAIGTLLYMYMCCRPFSSSSSSSAADSDVADSAADCAAVADDEDADIPPRREKYDVFISFRGEDTRLGITSHLHAALLQKKIETYIDNRLQRGEEIGPALLEAIEKSTISVIIFSQHYASSTWCLDELVHILKCNNREGRMVIPVFYDINPSDVRKQRGSYADAFAQLEKRFDTVKVHKWRDALKTAAYLSGFDYSNKFGTEADLIKNVVDGIWTKLICESSCHLEGLVGIESRIQQIEELLGIDSQDACVTVGIWGMGGIGKTTLAEAVFHRHSSKFEASCFLKNVRENSEQTGGLDHLEKILLKEILKEEVLPVGSTFVRERLSRTKVLIVLDDVSDSMQLERLAGGRLRYGTGSRIIITSRDRGTLKQTVEEDNIYEVEVLKSDDALQLFCSRAFKNNSSRRTDYEELAEKVVAYAKGVPLALTVLGSLFFNCKSKEEWEDGFNKLKRFPSESIQKVLRISYDRLEKNEKEIFLDVAVADCAAVADDEDADIPPRREKYDVFISFRVEDTRLTFTSHLHDALLQKKIETYMDNRLQRGDKIGPALLEAIEKSTISVIVFSQNYASSTRCLDELVHILKCKERCGQMVIPIFYHTNASDVRKQHRSYGDAFAQHQKRFKDSIDKVHKWREALTTAANLTGFHHSENAGTDADLIKEVVKDIWTKLCRKSSYDLRGSVGIESRIEQIESLLGIHSPDACITVGIWGMDGIGKTTLAEAVFHRHSSKFEASCFVKNVRKNSERADGLDRLEKALLKEILKEEILPTGSARVRKRLSRTRVLIVLDDVSDSMQMERLAGDRLRYGTGSRIIITSRDSRTLGQTVEKDKIYEVQRLKLDDAFQLFCSRAFKNNSTRRTDYKELAEKAVDYARSVPLALIVLGSLFFNCKSKQDWENEFNKLKRFPSESIQRVLRLSYDGLERHEKEIFLDLACFHQGRHVDMVKRMLDVRGFFARAGIRFLIDMSLISTYSKRGRETIEMHDLLEEMGRTIVQVQCIEDPGKRNRLFTHEDVYRVLKDKKETPIVEAVRVNWSKIEEQPLKHADFKKMSNLILLIVDYFQIFDCELTTSLDLPDSLRYLEWPIYPMKSLPSNFSPENLVELHMPYSKVEKLWKEDQILVNLQVIDLACSNLTEVPNLSGSPKIVHINLRGCYELVEIPRYFQHLDKLIHLDLGRCKNLKHLPEMPENIRYLDLRGSGIKELLESVWSNENISYLDVSHCKYLEKLPSNRCKLKVSGCFNLDHCTSLGEFSELPRDISKLSLVGCERLVSLPTNICKLKYLEELDLSSCSELENFPDILESMEHLKFLNLSGTAIKELHSSIEFLPALKRIQLQDCKRLSSIPRSICKLKYLEELDLNGCARFSKLEILEPMEHLKSLNLSGTTIEVLHSSIATAPADADDTKTYDADDMAAASSSSAAAPSGATKTLKSLNLSGTTIEGLHSSIATAPADADDTKTYDADAMVAASSSSAAAPSGATKMYDVFISFRGEDTRRTFTSHLRTALHEKKIRTYTDDKLNRGDKIAPALLEAVEKSTISVIIFSQNYASSAWCLDEVVHILECKERYGQMVIPVFYDIYPSDVRNQHGSYADAFAQLEKRFDNSIDKVHKWRDALTTAANLSGFDYSNRSGTEADLIEKVVDHIWIQLCRETSCDLNGFVGIESRIKQIELLLGIHSPDACITVGIWGMGGIGKTTLAEAVFCRHSSKFKASCFLKNVWEKSEKADGLDHLEKTLLKEILKEEGLSIGSTWVRERLRRTQVLIVLDDVSSSIQVERLAGDCLRYGTGSRIIITTRDRGTLWQTVEEDNIYEVEVLKSDDALQLFCSHAFKNNSTCRTDYVELAEKAVAYAKGVPLALTVLGSLFFNCKSKEEWEDEFNKLKRFPSEDIQKVLRISYDRLRKNEKEIFLDIACFHKGNSVVEVKRMLDARGFFAASGIRILVEMSLISIDSKRGWETIEMHDLLEEMGRTIVRVQCIKDPGKRNRLFTHEDVYRVLKDKGETPIVEAVRVNWSKIEEQPLKHADFKKMSNLILLIVNYFQIFDCELTTSLVLPDSLRYLEWPIYPMKSLPSNFSPKNLVELHMPYSKVEKLWKEDQILVNLQVIDLACSNLTEVPNLSGSPKIVHINLHGCYELVEIPGYFQHLDKLIHLDLGRCKNLKHLPEMPENIRHLDLRGSGIKELPESVWSNENISYLDVSHCKYLEKLPSNRCKLKVSGCFNLDHCTSLGEFSELPRDISKLSLVGCERLVSLPTNICKLKYLEELDLSSCSELENFPDILEPMEHLKFLNLSGTAIKELHSSIEFLPALKRIQLQDCKRLSSIPRSICKLKYLEELNLNGCSRFFKFPEILEPMEHLKSLNLSGTAIEGLH